MLLVAVIAGYARRISGEADRQHSLALDRLGRLADANALLFSLHRVTQTLPASLDLDEVLDTTIGRLRGLFDFDSAAILASTTPTATGRSSAARAAAAARQAHRRATCPRPLRAGDRTSGRSSACRTSRSPAARAWPPRPARASTPCCRPAASIIGLLAVEHADERHFTDRDVELLKGFVEPVALAIDNARWFARLRTVGADEERTRIARDLHDRIGQSLAYLAFELDRIVASRRAGARTSARRSSSSATTSAA